MIASGERAISAAWLLWLHYLRFNAGDYGASKLRELAAMQNHPRAAEIRTAAAAMIAQQESWQPAPPANRATLPCRHEDWRRVRRSERGPGRRVRAVMPPVIYVY